MQKRREEFVAAARSMIGNTWSHQARSPGVAVDCGGLVVCAAAMVGITMSDEFGYSRRPWVERMLGAMARNFERIDDLDLRNAPLGAVLLFGIKKRDRPQHLGVWVGGDRFVHSWADYRQVIESSYEPYWRDRLHSVWDFRETTWAQ
jgi:cell wall-associated NlpC family hydrolase